MFPSLVLSNPRQGGNCIFDGLITLPLYVKHISLGQNNYTSPYSEISFGKKYIPTIIMRP